MTQSDIIQTILKDSDYHLDLFTNTEVQALREEIRTQTIRGKETQFIRCPVRRKPVQLKPEELIRQLYAARLLGDRYRYPLNRVRFEYPVNFGRERKRADIVILDKDRPDTPYIIVEVKKPKLQDGKDQLRSYCNATGAPIAVWTNGQQISIGDRIKSRKRLSLFFTKISKLKLNRKFLNPLTYASRPKTFWNMPNAQSKSQLSRTNKLLLTGWNLL